MRSACMLLVSTVLALQPGTAQILRSPTGLELDLNTATGSFTIRPNMVPWKVGGEAGRAIRGLRRSGGRDGIGVFTQVTFTSGESSGALRTIRLYLDEPVVLFFESFIRSARTPFSPFPLLTRFPGGLLVFRYSGDTHLKPPRFSLTPDSAEVPYAGPVVLFDREDNACILSPASAFMTAEVSGDLASGLASGILPAVQRVDSGFTRSTVIVFGRGINAAFDEWGRSLTRLHGKKRGANDEDVGLRYLGYWTDNGAAYYYNYRPALGYTGTLLALKNRYDSLGIPIRYMQLDSWWYPKSFRYFDGSWSDSLRPHSRNPAIPAGQWNRFGGMLEYRPDTSLFPRGLADFHRKLGLPLITHDRWVDPGSPYHQHFAVSGLGIVDPRWWDDVTGDLASAGVRTYEQDWLSVIDRYSPEFLSTTGTATAFMDLMAAGTAKHGLTMQYCMVLPQHVMQGGSSYGNLTTIRTSDDRFSPRRYREFLYGSRFVSALGVHPWADVFMSCETGNILLATLSAGMVGTGDEIGTEDTSNIFLSVRGDGVIVKPDAPIVPLDTTFINEAERRPCPLVAASYTDTPGEGPLQRVWYLFAFRDPVAPDSVPWTDLQIPPSTLGMTGTVFVYDFFSGSGKSLTAGTLFSVLEPKAEWSYRVLVPVGPSGIALVGDRGKFVTRGVQRIRAIREDHDHLDVTLLFARNEKIITLLGYSAMPLHASARGGAIGAVSHDAGSGLFSVSVALTTHARRSMDLSEPVALTVVRLERERP